MNLNYEVVPNIISGKDLDYLSDMFNWNYGAYKSTVESINNVNDNEIKEVLKTASQEFLNNLTVVTDILQNGGTNEQ